VSDESDGHGFGAPLSSPVRVAQCIIESRSFMKRASRRDKRRARSFLMEFQKVMTLRRASFSRREIRRPSAHVSNRLVSLHRTVITSNIPLVSSRSRCNEFPRDETRVFPSNNEYSRETPTISPSLGKILLVSHPHVSQPSKRALTRAPRRTTRVRARACASRSTDKDSDNPFRNERLYATEACRMRDSFSTLRRDTYGSGAIRNATMKKSEIGRSA